MSIIEQAKIELTAVNFGEEDSKVMIEILEKFFDQWESGGAVFCAAPVLQRLISGQPLSPLSGQDDEWNDVSEMAGQPCFQNRRCSSVFKQDSSNNRAGRGGMHPYDIDNPAWDGKFPYDPTTKSPSDPVVEL